MPNIVLFSLSKVSFTDNKIFACLLTYFRNLKRSRDPEHIPSWVIYHAYTQYTPTYQSAHDIWSAYSIINAKDMIEGKIKKKRVTWPWPRPLRGYTLLSQC